MELSSARNKKIQEATLQARKIKKSHSETISYISRKWNFLALRLKTFRRGR